MAESPALLGPRKRPRRLLLYVSSLIVLSAIVGFGIYKWYLFSNPCELEDVEYASTVLLTQMRRYDDVYASAANGTRTSIDYPITVMQQILVDTQDVEVPACMWRARSELIDYMGDAIHAFKAFQAEKPDTVIQSLLDSSYAHVRAFRAELEVIKDCAPYCAPWR